MPWAADNGLFHGTKEPPKPPEARAGIYELLSKAHRLEWPTPMFAVVPDIPYCGHESLELSLRHLAPMRELYPRVPFAVAVQDGMEQHELRRQLMPFDWLFVAGSTEWKLAEGADWVKFGHRHGKQVHIGRVNSAQRLRWCVDIGADSADGTGMWRGPGTKKNLLTVLNEGCLFETDSPITSNAT